nr:hypothetical protein [Methanobacterium formicicum]
MGEIKRGFELIFDEIPYIGGDDNFLTMDLVSAAQDLALYQVLKRHDKPVEEIGEIAYQESEQYLRDNADLIPPMTHPKYVFYIEMAAKESLKRKYPGDWAYKFIPQRGRMIMDWILWSVEYRSYSMTTMPMNSPLTCVPWTFP